MRSRLIVLICSLAPSAFCADAKVDFIREVQPLFQQKCIVCHGAKQHVAGLRLDDRDSAKRVIQPGNAAGSKLTNMVKGPPGKIMPPVGQKLPPKKTPPPARWIDQGPAWPATASTARHWAWEPIQHPAAPAVR